MSQGKRAQGMTVCVGRKEKSLPQHQTNCFLCFGWSQHANTIYEDLKGHMKPDFFFLSNSLGHPEVKDNQSWKQMGYRTCCCVAISKGGYG